MATVVVPRKEELVANTARHGGHAEAFEFFSSGMQSALSGMAKAQLEDFPAMFHLTFPSAITRLSVVKEIGHAKPPFRCPFP
jgi:hypothetical protein